MFSVDAYIYAETMHSDEKGIRLSNMKRFWAPMTLERCAKETTNIQLRLQTCRSFRSS